MANRETDIRKFERVADQRLTAAGMLLKAEFNLEATYLAGYCVECALKALILKRTPRRGHGPMMERLTEVGAKGHDFEYLKGLLKQLLTGGRPAPNRGVLPEEVSVMLGRVASWSTDLRYEVGRVETADAEAFLAAATIIRDWARRS
jgi:hypothetical protein